MEASLSGTGAHCYDGCRKKAAVKILFSITYYHPYISGLTLAAARWAEGLVQKGNTVTVLAMQHERNLPLYSRIRGVIVHCAPWIIRISKGFLSWEWLVLARRFVAGHDVVVIHLPQAEGIIPAIIARLYGKRVVALYHCEPELPGGFVAQVIQSIMEVSHFLTLLLADEVVTYTRDYAKYSKVLTMWEKQTRRDAVAITPPVLKPGHSATLTREFRGRIGHGDVIVGIAARLAAEKGIEYLLDALPILRSLVGKRRIKLVVAGPLEPVGEAAYRRKIMSLVKKHARHVVFLGSVNPKYMGSFYRCIDVLVLPSVNRTEAFGMVQIEAMRMGVPVVASNLPGVRIPVQKTGMGEVVLPRDSHKLAEGIYHVITDKERYSTPKKPLDTLFSPAESVTKLLAVLS